MTGRALAELISVGAVVGGLFFVGMEIRQNNRIAQAAAFQAIGEMIASDWAAVAQDSVASIHILESLGGDAEWYAQLSPGRRAQEIAGWVAALRRLEAIQLQVEVGLLDASALDRFGWYGLEELEVLHAMWPDLGPFFDPSFRAFVTAEWDSVPPLNSVPWLTR